METEHTAGSWTVGLDEDTHAAAQGARGPEKPHPEASEEEPPSEERGRNGGGRDKRAR